MLALSRTAKASQESGAANGATLEADLEQDRKETEDQDAGDSGIGTTGGRHERTPIPNINSTIKEWFNTDKSSPL